MKKRNYWLAGALALLLMAGLYSCGGKSTNQPTLPQATQIATYGSLPRWSPDGQKLAFGGSGTNAGIWVWTAASGSLTRIVDAAHPHNYDYRWSAGSDKITFSGAGSALDSLSGIFTVNVDGTGLTRRHASGMTPAWIPDGSGLVFAEDATQSGLQGLFRLELSSGQTTRLTETGVDPQVNATGTTLAFRDANIANSTYRLKVIPLGGGTTTTLADTCLHFVWTLDGNSLVYDYSRSVSTSDPGYRINRIMATGGVPAKIVQGGAEPSISANGILAHHQVYNDLGQGIFVINLDGAGFTQLTQDGAQPNIKPDGSTVALSNGNGIWLVNP